MMKITIGMKGATPVAPDYTMLKTALMAVQASTPTARANRRRTPQVDPHAALRAIFSGDTGLSSSAAALEHGFSTEAPKPDDMA